MSECKLCRRTPCICITVPKAIGESGSAVFAEYLALREQKDAELAALRQRFAAPIVCMCGSTRFKQAWITENARLTGEGFIVLAVGLWGHHERVFPDEATKQRLDDLHKRKIDLCDWVWVLDIGGYIGSSTRSEIEYAEAHGKPVRYLSREFHEYVEPVDPLVETRQRLAAAESQLAEAMGLLAWAHEWVSDGVIAGDENNGFYCSACSTGTSPEKYELHHYVSHDIDCVLAKIFAFLAPAPACGITEYVCPHCGKKQVNSLGEDFQGYCPSCKHVHIPASDPHAGEREALEAVYVAARPVLSNSATTEEWLRLNRAVAAVDALRGGRQVECETVKGERETVASGDEAVEEGRLTMIPESYLVRDDKGCGKYRIMPNIIFEGWLVTTIYGMALFVDHHFDTPGDALDALRQRAGEGGKG